MPECNKPSECPYVSRIEALEKANERHGESHNQIYERLRKVETENAVQVQQYAHIIEKLNALTESHTELKNELAELKAKPGKRWEGIADKVIWAVLVGFIAVLGVAAIVLYGRLKEAGL